MSLFQIKTARGYRTIGDKTFYFKSAWEANYCRFLEFKKAHGLILDWMYEPQTFWFLEIKRGVRSYKPDFKVLKDDGTHYWVEVKGYFDSRSKTKIKRFRKYYPQEQLLVIDRSWFTYNNKKNRLLIKDWE